MTRYYTICVNITYVDLISCSSRWTRQIEIYWIDLIDSALRQLEDPALAGKLYHQFEQQDDGFRNRAFEKANMGLIFESFQILDMECAPALIIIASDAPHHGNLVFRPIYCKLRLLFDVLCDLSIFDLSIFHAYSTKCEGDRNAEQEREILKRKFDL